MQDRSPLQPDRGQPDRAQPDHAAGPERSQGSRPARPAKAARARKRWTWHRYLKLALEAGIGVLAGLIILSGVAVWRLSSEPVRLDFLTPYLEQAFNSEERGLLAEVEETLLTWEGWPRNVDLRVRRLLLRDPEGQPVAFLPDVAVTLSLRALLKGTIAPTRVEVIRPLIVVERQADGRFMIGSAQAGETQTAAPFPPHGEGKQILRAVVDDLLARPDPRRRLSFMTRIRIEDAQVAVRDKVRGVDWHASKVILDLRRGAPGITGEMAAQLDLPDSPVGVEMAFTYDEQSGLVDLASSFGGLQIASLPGDWSALERLRGLQAPLGGSVAATLSLGGRLDSATFDIAAESGLLDLGDLLPEPRPLRGLNISGAFDGREQRIKLYDAHLDFGSAAAPGPGLTLSGEALLWGDSGSFAGELKVSDLAMAETDLYWPLGMDEGARDWITENITAGTLESGQLTLRASVGPDGGLSVDPDVLNGSFRYRGLEIHYLRPMPPIRQVTGSATFDARGMRFKAEGGRSGEIEIGATDLTIEGFDRDGPEIMEIKFPAKGPLRARLELLNHERLGLIDKLGLDPAQTAGRAESQTTFRFPLLSDLSFDEVELVTQAELFDVAIGKLLLGKDAAKGRLSLALDKDAMWVRGSLELDGVPLQLDWREAFSDGPGPQSQYQVRVPSMDDAARARFGFDFLEGLSGPISASLAVKRERDESGSIEAALNMQQAQLVRPELHWSKAAGEPGEVRFVLTLAGDRLVALRDLEAAMGNMTLSANARFDAAGERLEQIRFDRLTFNDNDLTNVTVNNRGEGLDIEIGGGVLNAAPFLDDEDEDTAAAADEPAEPLRLVARNIRRLSFGDGRYLEGVAFALDRPAERWEQIQLIGQVPQHLWQRDSQVAAIDGLGEAARDGRFIEINYRPKPGGGNKLDVVTNDAGSVLRALDLLDTVEGGEMTITGEREAPGGVLRASVEADDFTLIDAPVLAEVLLVASLTGIVDVLSSDGIPFERLVGEVTLEDDVIKSELLRAYGASLGITAKGEVDLEQDGVDLRGTIVPVYGLNQLLGEIPVLGTILTGGEGEGFVAFTYDVTGTLDAPQASVNPLSALAPGWLRGIFSGEGKGEEPTVFPEGKGR